MICDSNPRYKTKKNLRYVSVYIILLSFCRFFLLLLSAMPVCAISVEKAALYISITLVFIYLHNDCDALLSRDDYLNSCDRILLFISSILVSYVRLHVGHD